MDVLGKQHTVSKIHWVIKARKLLKMIDSLSIWLSSGGTDILGLQMNFKEWRLILDAFLNKSEERPQVGGREKYQSLKWKKLSWIYMEAHMRACTGVIWRTKKSFQRSINAICFRDWIWRLRLTRNHSNVACYAHIGESGALLWKSWHHDGRIGPCMHTYIHGMGDTYIHTYIHTWKVYGHTYVYAIHTYVPMYLDEMRHPWRYEQGDSHMTRYMSSEN